jgi:hypothetical protein
MIFMRLDLRARNQAATIAAWVSFLPRRLEVRGFLARGNEMYGFWIGDFRFNPNSAHPKSKILPSSRAALF